MTTLLLCSTDFALRTALLEQLRQMADWQIHEGAIEDNDLKIEENAFILDSAGLSDQQITSCCTSKPAACVGFVLIDQSFTATTAGMEQIRKPFRLGYLLARLRFHLLLQQHKMPRTMSLGPYVFDVRARSVTHQATGTSIALSDKESELLAWLCASEAPQHRLDLLRDLWGYDSTLDTHTLETHIYRLRQKLPLPDAMDLFTVEQGQYQLNPALPRR